MEYTVLYTHQKQKKAKTWHDGFLKLATNGHKATLTDEKNMKLDVVHLKSDQVNVGDELESDRYLIQVEGVHKETVEESNPTMDRLQIKQLKAVVPYLVKPAAQPTIRASGLKRKNTGFRPPRLVKPKLDNDLQENQQRTILPNVNSSDTEISSQNGIQQNNPEPLQLTFTSSANFASLYSQEHSTNRSSPQLLAKHLESANSLPSPWSVVGKPKPQTSFSTPYSNRNLQDMMHDSKPQVQSSFVEENSSESIVVVKGDLNNDIKELQTNQPKDSGKKQSGLMQKRSTSQILALLGGKNSTFQVPKLKTRDETCLKDFENPAIQNSDIPLTFITNSEKNNTCDKYLKAIAQTENTLGQDNTCDKYLKAIAQTENTLGKDNISLIDSYQPKQFCDSLTADIKNYHEFQSDVNRIGCYNNGTSYLEKSCNGSKIPNKLECNKTNIEKTLQKSSDITTFQSQTRSNSDDDFRNNQHKKNTNLIAKELCGTTTCYDDQQSNVNSDNYKMKSVNASFENDYVTESNTEIETVKNEKCSMNDNSVENNCEEDTLLPEVDKSYDANDTGCFDINFSPLSNVSVSDDESYCDNGELQYETVDHIDINDEINSYKNNSSPNVKLKEDNNIDNKENHASNIAALNKATITNVAESNVTNKNELSSVDSETKTDKGNHDNTTDSPELLQNSISKQCNMSKEDFATGCTNMFDDSFEYVSMEDAEQVNGLKRQELSNNESMVIKSEENCFTDPQSKLLNTTNSKTINVKGEFISDHQSRSESPIKKTLSDNCKTNTDMNLTGINFTPENNEHSLGYIVAQDSIERVMSSVAMHVKSMLLPQLDNSESENSSQDFAAHKKSTDVNAFAEEDKVNKSSLDQSESIFQSQTTIDTMATFSQDSLAFLEIQQQPSNTSLSIINVQQTVFDRSKPVTSAGVIASQYFGNTTAEILVDSADNEENVIKESGRVIPHSSKFATNITKSDEKSVQSFQLEDLSCTYTRASVTKKEGIQNHGGFGNNVNTRSINEWSSFVKRNPGNVAKEDPLLPRSAVQCTKSRISNQDFQKTLHKSLPHPSELIGSGDKLMKKSEEHLKEPREVISMANSKLRDYTIKGTVMGCMVTRENPKVYNKNTFIQNASPEPSWQSVVARSELQPPSTPDLCAEEEEEKSLYYFNPTDAFKKQFGNENNFIVTRKEYLQQLKGQKASPVQQVPNGEWKPSQEMSNKMESKSDRKHMEPIITKPFGDNEDKVICKTFTETNTEIKEKEELKRDNHFSFETPIQNKVPIWMKDSPGDFSFSQSPFCTAASRSRLNISDQVNVISMGLDNDSQDSQVPNIDFSASPKGPNFKAQKHTPFGRNLKNVDNTYRKPVHLDKSNNSSTFNDRYSFNQLRTNLSTVYRNPLSKNNNVTSQQDSELERVDIYTGEESKWNKFHSYQNDRNLMRNKTRTENDTKASSAFNNRRDNSQLYSVSSSVCDNIKTNDRSGVDHLVPVSPTNRPVIELTSDVSTDNDSQCTLNDDLFDESIFNDVQISNFDNVSDHHHPKSSVKSSTTCQEANIHSKQLSGIMQSSNRVSSTEEIDEKRIAVVRKGFKAPRSALLTGNTSNGGSFSVPYNKHSANSLISSSENNMQRNLCGELYFPSSQECDSNITLCRQITIPVTFSSAAQYKQVFTAALNEYLNIQLFEVSKNYHTILSKVDVSNYVPADVANFKTKQRSVTQNKSNNPPCEHGQPSKILQVKKDGPNKGRFFFVCNGPRTNQCKLFKWADEVTKNSSDKNNSSSRQNSALVLSDAESIGTYFKGQGTSLYCECLLLRKAPDSYKPFLKNFPSWAKHKKMELNDAKKKLYIKLSRKENSALYTKDDLWVVTQHLSFDSTCTFVAKSVFFGPTANSEVEIEPISGYSPSNWSNECLCHAVHVGNASNELVCLSNLQDFVQPTTLPVLPNLLSLDCNASSSFMQKKKIFYGYWNIIQEEAENLIKLHNLNDFQADALRRVADMFNSENEGPLPAVSLIHGVFGAGKSFLLAVIVKFLVRVFESKDIYATDLQEPTKLLISSTTNVAVDRILLGLLDLNFDQFVRVGSIKKIAKPILPYSMHATGTDSHEMKDLQEMMKSDITPQEKVPVRKRMDQLRKGENKRQLENVRVVGATCAACPFQSLKGFRFSVVMLDECSQITEPASLLPIARFFCEKVILVGDPKQLDPTLQGAEAAHQQGLEQTLFDRLIKMGYEPTMLKTQYRCHPCISAIANNLFYDNQLHDGVTEDDRPPLATDWPTLCFFDVSSGTEVCERSNSFANEAEASFVVLLIEMLVIEGVPPTDIGVITLYRAQQSKIAQLLHGSSLDVGTELRAIQISTVDAFQGGERGVIILSTVRTNSTGFMDNDKRTNVALTRSRNHLFIVGNRKNLWRNSLWAQVLKHCHAFPSGVQNAESFRKMLLQKKEQLQEEATESRAKKKSSRKIATVDQTGNSAASSQDTISQSEITGKSSFLSYNDPPAMESIAIGSCDFATEETENPFREHTNISVNSVINHTMDSCNSNSNSPVAFVKRKRKSQILQDIIFDSPDNKENSDEDLPKFF